VECGIKKNEKYDFKYLKSGIPDFLPVFIRENPCPEISMKPTTL
jgi:hypothetical protein